jgi:hypothetical protein
MSAYPEPSTGEIRNAAKLSLTNAAIEKRPFRILPVTAFRAHHRLDYDIAVSLHRGLAFAA